LAGAGLPIVYGTEQAGTQAPIRGAVWADKATWFVMVSETASLSMLEQGVQAIEALPPNRTR